MKRKILSCVMVLALSQLVAEEANSNNLPDFDETGKWIILPYAFSSDATGLAGGAVTISQGLFQPQTTLVASLFYGLSEDIITNGIPQTDNFKGGFLSYSNIKVPYTTRFFLSSWGIVTHYPADTIYINGSNDSSEDGGLLTADDNNYFTVSLKYVLPIGEGIDNPDGIYKMRNGFAMDREGYGNGTPFVTGQTSLSLMGFYQYQTIENWKESEPWVMANSMPKWNDSGLRLKLLHDNTDFDLNPSRGYSLSLQYSKDFGWGDSLQTWDSIIFSASKYFTLKKLSHTQQNVLALNFWTAYSPSWDDNKEILPGIDAHRPPLWEGARLGGFNRLRAYDTNRYSDKAAIYATAEYRAILDWNPFKEDKWLEEYIPVDIDWLQVVGFVEAGRVNDQYNIDLLTDMKFDAGVSLRAMAANLPVRFDVAYGQEGINMWVMIRQPFDF